VTDVADSVDAELERFISNRAPQDTRPDRDENEELWKASVRAHNASRREEMRVAWEAFHEGQAERLRRTLGPLIAFHEARAEECRDQPKGAM